MKSKRKEQEQKTLSLLVNKGATEQYIAPEIEVIDIKLQQNILNGSSDELPSSEGNPWF